MILVEVDWKTHKSIVNSSVWQGNGPLRSYPSWDSRQSDEVSCESVGPASPVYQEAEASRELSLYRDSVGQASGSNLIRLHYDSHRQRGTENLSASGYSNDENSHANEVIPSSTSSLVREDLAARNSRAKSPNTLGIDVRPATSHVRFSDADDIRESFDNRVLEEQIKSTSRSNAQLRRLMLLRDHDLSLPSDKNQDWLDDYRPAEPMDKFSDSD